MTAKKVDKAREAAVSTYSLIGETLGELSDIIPYNKQSQDALFMITSHESQNGLAGRRQVTSGGKADGVARGITQVEPKTFDDIYNRYLVSPHPKKTYEKRQKLRQRLAEIAGVEDPSEVTPDMLVDNDKLAIALARVKLYTVPDALPKPSSPDYLERLADYNKKHYNAGGAATPVKYLNDFLLYSPYVPDYSQPKKTAGLGKDSAEQVISPQAQELASIGVAPMQPQMQGLAPQPQPSAYPSYGGSGLAPASEVLRF